VSGGISAGQDRSVDINHSATPVQSNGVAVPLSATPLWVVGLFISLDDTNPAASIGTRAYFGNSAVSPTAYGMYRYAGDEFPWPFDGPVPVHKIYYYQDGGLGKLTWVAMKRT
jgi:hypothetical protein